MKTLLMIAAMIGVSYSGIAQHTTKHKTSTKHAKTKTVAKATECATCESNKPSYTSKTVALGGREATWNRLLSCSKAKRMASARKAEEAPVAQQTTTTQRTNLCYSYRKNNILVTECPHQMSDPSGLEMSSQATFGGYYPGAGIITTVNPVLAPQSPNVNNYKGPAPASGNQPGPIAPPNKR